MAEMTTSYLAVFRWFPPQPHYWIDAKGEWHDGPDQKNTADAMSVALPEGKDGD